MSIERINPGELAQPSGFSHAVAATGGRLVFLAGQTGYGADGAIVAGSLVPQFERALANLLAALRAAGGGACRPGQPDDLRGGPGGSTGRRHARSARHGGELCGREYPAMAAVGVSRLWDTSALVEIQASAVAAGAALEG